MKYCDVMTRSLDTNLQYTSSIQEFAPFLAGFKVLGKKSRL
jgi:hypothetical protein